MDPLNELSTLVASYVITWRDLCSADTVPTRESITFEAIHESARGDIAVFVRMREMAARAPEERWTLVGALKRETDGTEVTDIDEIATQVAKREGASSYAAVSSDPALKRKCLEELCRTYLQHLGDVADMLHGIGLGGTREGLIAAVSERLLATPTNLRKLSESLDYVPILLRAHRDARPTLLDHYPDQLIDYCLQNDEPLPFAFVLHEELREVNESRTRRRVLRQMPKEGLVEDRAFAMHLVGLCLSGGGIRSATFNLGILQALASRGWLRRIDYLSTVSGGGYIGAWLLAWIKRQGSVGAVEDSLRRASASRAAENNSAPENPDPAAEHVRPIRFLREYSNYLAPKAGFFSTDTWTLIAIWIRNTVLNLVVLALFFMALLIMPRALGLALFSLPSSREAATAAVLMLVAVSALVGWNLSTFDQRDRSTRASSPTRGDTALMIMVTIVLPLFVAAFLATAALWLWPEARVGPEIATATSTDWWERGRRWLARADRVFLWAAGCCFASLFLASAVGHFRRREARDARAIEHHTWYRRHTAALRATLRSSWTSAIAALLGGGAGMLLSRVIVPLLWENTERGLWLAIAFGPLVIFLALTAVIILYLGLEGYHFPDERREWWSRLGAQIGLVGTGWALVACVSLFAPLWVAQVGLYASGAGISWALVTTAGARLASGGHSNGVNLRYDRNPFTAALIKAAPFVFILGFLVLLSLAAHVLLLQVTRLFPSPDRTAFDLLPFQLERYVRMYWAMLEPRSWAPLAAAAGLCLGALFLAWRVDVNEFSMHHFYRNRLVRAYLGASRSRRHRTPNAFTGLDLDDDIKLWRFTHDDPSMANDASSDCRAGFSGPFPIINAALNLTTGEDLAWQERKAQSFVFTPLYCGYDFSVKQAATPATLLAQFAYRPTKQYGYKPRWWRSKLAEREAGLGIGTAIAISGAAANPNAGFHSSPAVAFLLTVFNARLGWWMGNPRRRRWNHSSPGQGLFYLLSELFGFANTKRNYLNLSDGGHFDNMGLYELIRRRCRYIVVCDAEQDENYSMQGLANAIRKCRVDFGVDIMLDTTPVVPDEKTKLSRAHVARGCIRYPGQRTCGTIVYVKSSVVGIDEPTDVLEYRRRFPVFPHQVTGDQFFDESQFESYRALGQHIGESLPDDVWDSLPEAPMVAP